MTYWLNMICDFVFAGLFEAENDDLEILKDTATKLKLLELADDIEKSKRRSAGKNRNKNKSKSDICTIKRVTNLKIYQDFLFECLSVQLYAEFYIQNLVSFPSNVIIDITRPRSCPSSGALVSEVG